MKETKLSYFYIVLLFINSLIFTSTMLISPITTYLASLFTPLFSMFTTFIYILVPVYIIKRNPNLLKQVISINLVFTVFFGVIFLIYIMMTFSSFIEGVLLKN